MTSYVYNCLFPLSVYSRLKYVILQAALSKSLLHVFLNCVKVIQLFLFGGNWAIGQLDNITTGQYGTWAIGQLGNMPTGQ